MLFFIISSVVPKYRKVFMGSFFFCDSFLAFYLWCSVLSSFSLSLIDFSDQIIRCMSLLGFVNCWWKFVQKAFTLQSRHVWLHFVLIRCLCFALLTLCGTSKRTLSCLHLHVYDAWHSRIDTILQWQTKMQFRYVIASYSWWKKCKIIDILSLDCDSNLLI